MLSTITNNAPKARCYKCGTPNIQYICHHCGRPMCVAHTCFLSVHKNSKSNQNSSRKLITDEFKGLGLKGTECGEEPYHCENHAHIAPMITWKKIILGITILIISLFISNGKIKMWFLLPGGLLAGYGVYGIIQRKKNIASNQPDFPLLPTFEKISIKERTEGRIQLDSEGNYNFTLSNTQGQLDISTSLNPKDIERLKLYRKKYNAENKFHAGFAVLQGSAGIILERDIANLHGYINANGVVIPLMNPIEEQPYLNGGSERNSHRENFNIYYNLLENSNESIFPIQLVISFLSDSDQRGIEIRVQQYYQQSDNNSDNKLRKLDINEIRLLELNFTIAWGKIINLSDPGYATVDQNNQIISWQKIKENDIQSDYHTFQVQFENRITALGSSINGRLKVVFNSTLSGLENIKIYFPTGNTSGFLEKNQVKETEVDIDFDLSLATLRYQHIKKISDGRSQTNDFNRDENFIFRHVSPSYKTVILMTDKISEQGFYIKQVIENPSTNEAIGNVNVIKRSWTIFGRWYDGVFPIDFQIYLNGQETDRLNAQIFVNSTTVSLTVTGSYCNPDMEELIENQWQTLNDLIHETFQHIIGEQLSYEPASLPFSSNDQPLDAEIIDDDDQENG